MDEEPIERLGDGEIGIGEVEENVAVSPDHDAGLVGLVIRDGGGEGAIVGGGGSQGDGEGVPAVQGEEDIHSGAIDGSSVGIGHVPGDGLGAQGGPIHRGIRSGDEEGAGISIHRHDHIVFRGATASRMVVADRQPEVEVSADGWQDFPSRRGVVQYGRPVREETGRADSRRQGSEGRTAGIGGGRRHGGHLVVHLLPTVGQAHIVGVAADAGQGERCRPRDGVIAAGLGGRTAGIDHGADGTGISGTGDEGAHFREADGMEIGIAVVLDIRGADAGVTHDGGGASRLHGGVVVAVAAVVLGVVGAILMAHLVGDIIHVEGVAHGVAAAGDSPGLVTGAARRTKGCDTASPGGEYMADVIVGGADAIVTSRLVLPQHGASVVVGIGVGAGIQED